MIQVLFNHSVLSWKSNYSARFFKSFLNTFQTHNYSLQHDLKGRWICFLY